MDTVHKIRKVTISTSIFQRRNVRFVSLRELSKLALTPIQVASGEIHLKQKTSCNSGDLNHHMPRDPTPSLCLQMWTALDTHLDLGCQEHSPFKQAPSPYLLWGNGEAEGTLRLALRFLASLSCICRILRDKVFILFKSGTDYKGDKAYFRSDFLAPSCLSPTTYQAFFLSLPQSCPQKSHFKLSFFSSVKIFIYLYILS